MCHACISKAFILLAALGGCDPQVAGHVTGSAHVGNNRPTMTDAITAVLPWIG
jgi:4-carboxymuconolactone decarboxylase